MKTTKNLPTFTEGVPVLQFPGITQEDFLDAFRVLEECMVTELPVYGFRYPFMGPGGAYGDNWWLRDTVLTLSGAKWLHQDFAENVLRNFTLVQKEDGRIPLYGPDQLPYVDGECSAIPRIFEISYDVLKRSSDQTLKKELYLCLNKYLDWWFSDKRRDPESGLITGVFEESDPSDCLTFDTKAHVDLNVQVLIGCDRLTRLAEELGLPEEAARFSARKKELSAAIHHYMYAPETGTYHGYLVKEKRRETRLCSNTFDPMCLATIPPERIAPLLKLLTDDRCFNWNSYPVTSAAKTDPEYIETRGDYKGYTSWMGNIWTFRNEIIISALNDVNAYDLSAELSYKTVMEFNHNYAEFISPADASPHGVKRYGWTASHYIQLIIEQIFGIQYSYTEKNISITPHICPQLYGQTLSLQSLPLPNGSKLTLTLRNTESSAEIFWSLSNVEPDFTLSYTYLGQFDSRILEIAGTELKQLPVFIQKGDSYCIDGITAAEGRILFKIEK